MKKQSAIFCGLLVYCLCSCFSHDPAHAQDPPRLFRDQVEPQWFGPDNRYFWYDIDTRDAGRQFMLVDAERGTREPLFDHQRLAAVLARVTGQPYDWKKLPIYSLEVEDLYHVRLFGPRDFLLDRTSYELTSLDDDNEINPRPEESLVRDTVVRPTVRTGPETYLTFINNHDFELLLYWIDTAEQKRPYGRIDAHGRRRQHTFGGHVWLLEDKQGTVQGVVEAPDRGGRVVVDDAVPLRPTMEPKGRPLYPIRDRLGVSPDGTWKARVKSHNLYLQNTTSGREVVLTLDATLDHTFRRDTSRLRMIEMKYDTPEAPDHLADVRWSPDGNKLLAFQTRKVSEKRVFLVNSAPRSRLQPTLESYPYLKAGDLIPVRTVRLFDIPSMREINIPTNLFPIPWEVTFERWSPDSQRLYLNYNQRGHQVLRLLEVDSNTGSVTPVIEERSNTFIHYSAKYYLAWIGDDGCQVVWMSERDGWNHLYRYDVAQRKLINQITSGPWNVKKVLEYDEQAETILFEAVGIYADQDPYHVHICRVNLDGTELVRLTAGDGMHRIEWSPDRKYFVDKWSRVDLPLVTELRDGTTGQLICELEQADASELIESGWSFPQRFTAKGRDGKTDIWGIIHFPDNFENGEQHPVIENIYAGPHDQHVPKRFRPRYPSQQKLTDCGFVVVQIDGMGTAWRSKAFHDVCYKNLRDAGFPDRIAWIKSAAEAFPAMDIERVGIYGGSAGGQSAMAALLWHHDFYDVAVADCGCHDNRLDKIWWNEQWFGWPPGPEFTENSNVENAHRLQGRLLLIVGELDKNVDPACTLQAVHALQKANLEFDFIMAVGAGHGAADLPHFSRRRRDFFIKHLRPEASQ